MSPLPWSTNESRLAQDDPCQWCAPKKLVRAVATVTMPPEAPMSHVRLCHACATRAAALTGKSAVPVEWDTTRADGCLSAPSGATCSGGGEGPVDA